MCSDKQPIPVGAALEVSRVLWPEFVEEHGCVFLGWHTGSNPPPADDTATGWESFINHTHVLDEFAHGASTFAADEVLYNENHPDFRAACELGQRIAALWVLKLKLDFPNERFRVYYTQYDNPIVRFHKVRHEEDAWLTDEALQTATDPSFRNALIYDTSNLEVARYRASKWIH